MVSLAVMFILGSVLLGAGALLAPALPGAPRIGLGAALALALLLCLALGWTMLFGWDTLVIDYVLFAMVTAMLLGGTLGRGPLRAARQGQPGTSDEPDAITGWPGALDLGFFALVATLFAIPTLLLPVPLDTDAQGFGYLALMARLSGSLDTLAPFHPEITYLYAPGFTLLGAWLSEQLGQPVPQVQFALAAVLGLLNVWLAHDLGSELGGRSLGRAVALALAGGLGLFLAYMDSHFTTLLALVFAQGCVLVMLRYQRAGRRVDLFCAALLLAAVLLSHPDTTIILALGLGPLGGHNVGRRAAADTAALAPAVSRRPVAGAAAGQPLAAAYPAAAGRGDRLALYARAGPCAADAGPARVVELAAGVAWRARGVAPEQAGDVAGAWLAAALRGLRLPRPR